MPERKGESTVVMSSRPTVLGYAAVVGKKEGEGPLGRGFDYVFEDTTMGEKSWEKAESALQKEAFTRALNKAGYSPSQVDYIFAGDLLNQCIASTFGLREFQRPLLGQFGACSTRHTFAPPSGSTVFRWNTAVNARPQPSGPPLLRDRLWWDLAVAVCILRRCVRDAWWIWA